MPKEEPQSVSGAKNRTCGEHTLQRPEDMDGGPGKMSVARQKQSSFSPKTKKGPDQGLWHCPVCKAVLWRAGNVGIIDAGLCIP